MLKSLSKFSFALLLVLLVLGAVLLGAARLSAPLLADYQPQLMAMASKTLGRAVSVQQMKTGWRGLSPVIRLVGVRVENPQSPERPLQIDEIGVRIDLLASLGTRHLAFSGIDVMGTSLTLLHDMDGSWSVEEFPVAASTTQIDLTAMQRLSISAAGISLRNLPDSMTTRHFVVDRLVMLNEGDRHRLSGRVHLPSELGEVLEVEARMQGTSPQPQDWQGRVYLRGESLQLGELMSWLRPDAQPVSGNAEVRLWAEVDAAALLSCTSELEVDDFFVQQDKSAPVSDVHAPDSLRATFGWQRRVQGWQAAVQQFRLHSGGRLWNIDNLSVAARTWQQNTDIHGIATRLPLEGLRGLLAVVPGLEPQLRSRLLGLHPTGTLEDVDLLLRQLPDSIELLSVHSRFSDLGVNQSESIPALSGLSGKLEGTPAQGSLELASSNVRFMDARVFAGPLQFDRVQGVLYWQGVAGGTGLRSDALQLENGHLALQAGVQLQLPQDGTAPVLDLQAQLSRAEVAHVRDYLPEKLMKPTAIEWLRRSLVGGVVTDGTVIIQGPLDKLPFDHGEGRLEIRLPVTAATLDFNEHWSPVEDLDAQVEFTGRQMDIVSSRGRIRSADLHEVHAQILDLAHPHLTIRGDVSGQMAVMLQELGSSPLGEIYGGFVDRVTAAGDADLGLAIDVPLEKDHLPPTVTGRIGLRGNRLAVRDTDIALTALKGRLEFDGTGIRGEQLSGRLYDQPLKARVWSEARPQRTLIQLTGPLHLLERAIPPGDKLRAAIADNADWQVLLTVRGTPARGQRADLGVEISSELQGTAIDLPAPIGKPADSARKLTFAIDNFEQQVREVRLQYSDVLHGVLLLQDGAQGMQLQRGVITLGDGRSELPNQKALLLTGKIEHFRYEDWKPHLHGGGSATLPLRVHAQVGELELLGHVIHDADLAIHNEAGSWIFQGSSPQFDGKARLVPAADGLQSVALDLKRLVLDPVAEPATAEPHTVLPGEIPALQIDARELVYDGVNFGALVLQGAANASGTFDINQFRLDSPMLALQVSGEWTVQGGHSRTRADLKVTDGKLGALLDALGYEKIVKDGDLSGSLQASWPGAPWDVKPEKLDGKLSLVIKNGQLLDVEPGATGRALGLLSIGKLPRRLLALDFTDLFGEGFGFDRIGGDVVLDSGNAWMDKLVVDGPAAKMELSGRVGLRAQDYDEVVTVTPYLNSGLTVAGAIAGGPVGAAAAIVAEKLMEGKLGLNEMARKQYTVTGPWAEPVIKPLAAAAPKTEAINEPFE